MKKSIRSCLAALLIPALALSSVCAVVEAAEAKATRWSDRATWPGRKVPVAGDKVTIPEGKSVILDVSPPALGGLTINGKLTFADNADVELTTEWVMIHGELQIGTEAKPHTRKATITLTDNVKEEEMMGMGDRGIMLSGGTLNLHGNRTNSWTKLAKTAEAGSNSIEVLDAAQWQVGDEIVLASTDFDPRQAEVRRITALSGNSLTLDRPLQYMHFGKITFDVDQRGEVGLLTRNIKIHASPDAEQSFFGGHIMAMVTSKMFVNGVELHRMGQNLELARYPIHWHLAGDAKGQYIRNAAIHDTYNRCVTVHGTHNLRVENNVTYNNVGHCFFMEDGIEHGNEFVRNLAIQTKCHTSKPCVPTNLAAAGESTEARQAGAASGQQSKEVLLPSDNTVASYWITNPDNTYRDNVAAGSDANGFWMSLPEHPNGAFEGSDQSKATWPRRTKFREFKGNVAHSNYDGFMFDRNIAANNTFGVTGSSHTGLENPADPNSNVVLSVFENLTTYKNRNGGIWGRGEAHLFRNVKFADNAIGFTHAAGGPRFAYSSQVLDSLFVGETENIGNPTTEAEKAYGRSLPKPMIPDFPIRGYEWYDYRHDVVNTTFRNYQDNATRKTGAISHLLYTSFGASSNNAVEKLKFVDAKPVYYPLMEKKWGNDNNAGSLAYKSAVFSDKDGSLGQGPNSFVVINDGVNDSIAVDDQACKVQPAWNAAVCKGDVGRMSFVDGHGLGFNPISRGAIDPKLPPVILTRKDNNGRKISVAVGTNVRSGIEFTATTERTTMDLNVIELDAGSWVIVEMPGFTKAASGTAQDSLDALRKASTTSYYKAADALWVKLVSTSGETRGMGGGVTVQVSR
ncbi:MAG: transmembrane domain-containing protein [Proteobacteria bacterium]|nr:transmembrane domain-containing protein [Pseudomonadota bacterium]